MFHVVPFIILFHGLNGLFALGAIEDDGAASTMYRAQDPSRFHLDRVLGRWYRGDRGCTVKIYQGMGYWLMVWLDVQICHINSHYISWHIDNFWYITIFSNDLSTLRGSSGHHRRRPVKPTGNCSYFIRWSSTKVCYLAHIQWQRRGQWPSWARVQHIALCGPATFSALLQEKNRVKTKKEAFLLHDKLAFISCVESTFQQNHSNHSNHSLPNLVLFTGWLDQNQATSQIR